MDGSGQDPWTSPADLQFGDWTQPASAGAGKPADFLAPGASVCVDETFYDNANPNEDATVNGVQVTLVLGNGVNGRITLPAGGGAGPNCTI